MESVISRKRRILEEVTATSIALLLKEPFYSHFFSCLGKQVEDEDSSLKTMGVGLTSSLHTLFINPNFWDEFLIRPEHRYGVMKHEILHIVFKHTLVNPKGKNGRLVNIAMDLVINQYIERAHLPAEALFLEKFPELQLLKDQTWFYYYNRLLELYNNTEGKYKDSVAAKTLASISDVSNGLVYHDLWKEVYEKGDADRTLIEANTENLIRLADRKTTVKIRGKMPAGLLAWLDGILIKPQPLVDWRRVVRLFSESSCRTKVKSTIKRPSKRFGTVPGIKVRKLQKLLVAIDTSGSIHKGELADFFNEIYHIWRQGAEIQVVECDATIQKIYPYKGFTPQFVKGCGGTNFNPPVLYANNEFLPDGLIYFTDGWAPAPEIKSRCAILWVISKDGLMPNDKAFGLLPGRKAKLVAH